MSQPSPWVELSAEDPRLSCLSQLGGGGTATATRIVIEGELALRRALAAHWRPELVVATAAVAARLGDLGPGILAAVVPESAVSRLVGYDFHRGCIGVVPRPRPEPESWRAAIAGLGARRCSRVVALDRIADPRNVGAIVRTARALGVDLVVLGRGCADPYARRAVRASMGHVFAQPMVIDVDLAACIEASASLTWWATGSTGVAEAHGPTGSAPPPSHLGLVLGNEGDGVAEAIASRCARRVAIATRAGAESLNVAAAAAILIWSVDPGPVTEPAR